MATPAIYFITPTRGHTGGSTLVEIAGEGFAMSPPPVLVPGLPEPLPSVEVRIGGVRCETVWALHSGLIRCLTPKHGPSGLPARELDSVRRIPARGAIPASDVTVQNLDATGAPIFGEIATAPAAFSFVRPDLSKPGAVKTVMDAFILALQNEVIENVSFNPHTDYDPASGDATNVAVLAYLPGIAIVGMRCPDSQLQEQERGDEDFPDPDADASSQGQVQTIVRRSNDNVDLMFTLVAVTDNHTELLSMFEAVKVFFKKSLLAVAQIPSDPNSPIVHFSIDCRSEPEFSGRIDQSNAVTFSYDVAIRRVPVGAMPGLPTDTIRGVVTRGTAEDIVDVQTKGFTPIIGATQR